VPFFSLQLAPTGFVFLKSFWKVCRNIGSGTCWLFVHRVYLDFSFCGTDARHNRLMLGRREQFFFADRASEHLNIVQNFVVAFDVNYRFLVFYAAFGAQEGARFYCWFMFGGAVVCHFVQPLFPSVAFLISVLPRFCQIPESEVHLCLCAGSISSTLKSQRMPSNIFALFVKVLMKT
jgi:hypothetical protein